MNKFYLSFSLLALCVLSAIGQTPENLYLFGNYEGFNGNNISASDAEYRCVKFDKESPDVFILKNMKIGSIRDDGAGDVGSILLISEWGDNFSNPNRNAFYIKNSDGNPWPATLPATKPFVNNNTSYKISVRPGTYDIKLDFSKMEATFSEPTPIADVIKGYAGLYLHSSSSSTPLEFTKTDYGYICPKVSFANKTDIYISPTKDNFDSRAGHCLVYDNDGNISIVRATNAQNKSIEIEAGEYDFIINLQGDSPKLSFGPAQTPIIAPEKLYLFGEFEGFSSGIDKDNYIEFEPAGDKVFAVRNIVVKAGAKLLFADGVGDNYDSAKHYTNIDNELKEGSAPFILSAGTYDIRVDFSKDKPTVTTTPSTSLADVIKSFEALYLYLNGTHLPFSKTENGFEYKNVDITDKFYISTISDNFNSASSPCLFADDAGNISLVQSTKGNRAITRPAGRYNIRIELGDTPELVMEKVIGAPTHLYLFGDFEGFSNGIDKNNYIEFESDGNKFFAVRNIVVGENAKLLFADGFGSNYDAAKHYSKDTSNNLIESNDPFPLTNGTYDITVDFSKDKPTVITTLSTPLADVIKGFEALYLYQGSSKVTFSKTETGFECKNVNITDNFYISTISDNFNSASSPCLFADDAGNISLVQSTKGNRAITRSAGRYNIRIELGENPGLVMEKVIGAPTNLYLFGDFEGFSNGIDKDNYIEFESISNKVFAVRNIVVGEDAKLIFADGFGSNYDAAKHYSKDASNNMIESDDPFTLAAGTYDITVDFSKDKPTVITTPSTPLADVIKGFEALYLYQGSSKVTFSKTENGFECKNVDITDKFYISTISDNFNSEVSPCLFADEKGNISLIQSSKGNRAITRPAGRYNIRIELGDTPELVMEKVIGAPTHLYLFGDVEGFSNGIDKDNYIEFESDGNKVFAVRNIVVGEDAKLIFADGFGSNFDEAKHYSKDASNKLIESNEPFTLAAGTYDITVDFSKDKPSVVISPSAKLGDVIKSYPALYLYQGTSKIAFSKTETGFECKNVNITDNFYISTISDNFNSASSPCLFADEKGNITLIQSSKGNRAITRPAGRYNIRIELGDTPELGMEKVIGAPTRLYLFGDFEGFSNGIDKDNYIEFESTAEKTFILRNIIVSGNGELLFADGFGSNFDAAKHYSKGASNNLIESGEHFTVSAGTYDITVDFSKDKPTVTTTPSTSLADVIKSFEALYLYQGTYKVTFSKTETGFECKNVDITDKFYISTISNGFNSASSPCLVADGAGSITLIQSSKGNRAITCPAGRYNIRIELGDSPELVMEKVIGAPTRLYLFGDFEGFSNGIDKDNYIEFESTVEKTFTLKNITVGGNGKLLFADGFGSNFEAAKHYSKDASNNLIESNEPFTLAAGTYDITVDFSKDKPTVAISASTKLSEVIKNYPELYLYQGNTKLSFTKTETGFECKNVDITDKFYISSISENFNSEFSPCLFADEKGNITLIQSSKGNRAITRPAGRYNIRIELGDTPELVMEKVIGAPTHLYLFGDFEGFSNGIDKDNYIEFESDGNKVFAVRNIVVGENAKLLFADGFGSNFDEAKHYSKDASNNLIESNDPFTLAAGTYDITVDFSMDKPTGAITSSAKLGEVIKNYPELYLYQGTSKVSFDKTENGFECKHVDITDKFYISSISDNFNSASSPCLFASEDGTISLIQSSKGNRAITRPAGRYNIRIELGETPELIMEKVIGAPTHLYLFGDFEGQTGIDKDNYIEFESTAEKIFTLKNIAVGGNGKLLFADGFGSNFEASKHYSKDASNKLIESNDPFILAAGTYDLTVDFSKDKPTVAISASAKLGDVIKNYPALYFYQGTSKVAFSKTETGFECKNVDITDKFYISTISDNFNSASSPCLFASEDGTISLIQSSKGNRGITRPAGRYNIRIELGDTPELVVEKVIGAPSKLYLFGDFEGFSNGIDKENYIEFESISNKVFAVRNIVVGENAKLLFADGFGSNFEAAKHYSKDASNNLIESNEPFTLAAGTYDLTVDFSKDKPTVTTSPSTVLADVIKSYAALYLYQGTSKVAFAKTSTGFECKNVDITDKFYISTISDNFNSASSPCLFASEDGTISLIQSSKGNRAITRPAGRYNIRIELGDTPVLVMEKVIGAPSKFYLFGDFEGLSNGIDKNNYIEFESDGKKVFAVRNIVVGENAKLLFADGFGSNLDATKHYSKDASNNLIESNDPFTLAAGTYDITVDFSKDKPTVVISPSAKLGEVIKSYPNLYLYQANTKLSFSKIETGFECKNVDITDKFYISSISDNFNSASSPCLFADEKGNISLIQSSKGNRAITRPAGRYNIRIELGDTPELVMEKVIGAPTHLYLFGDFEGQTGIDKDNYIEFESDGNKVFAVRNIVVGEDAKLIFADGFGSNFEAAKHYSKDASNNLIESNDPFTLAAGTYDITVDFSMDKPTVITSPSNVLADVIKSYPALYLYQDNTKLSFTKTETGFECKNVNITDNFYISTISDNFNSASSPCLFADEKGEITLVQSSKGNRAITRPAGRYNIRIELGDTPVLVMEKVIGAPTHLYLFGDFEDFSNGIDKDNYIEFESDGNKIFAVRNIVVGEDAKLIFADGFGSNFEAAKHYSKDASNNLIESNDPFTLAAGTYDITVDFSKDKPTVVISPSAKLGEVIKSYPNLYLYQANTKLSFSKIETGFECKNVDITDKFYISSISDNFNSASSPCLFADEKGNISLIQSSKGNRAITRPAGRYNIRIELGENPELVMEKVIGAPAKLYLFGDFEGFSNGIDKDNYIEFESKSEKVFTLRNITIDVNTSLTSRNGLVALASDFGAKFDAAQHYFIQTEGNLLSAWPTKLPDSKELATKNEPFKIKAGTYDIRVDFSKTKPDVTFDVPTPIANIVHEYPQLYLYGIGNAPVKFTKTDDGFECKNVEITTENAKVYISPSPDFNAATSPCLIAGENNKLVLVRSTKGAKAITLQPGKYNITVDLPGGSPELIIQKQAQVTAAQHLYLFGDVEGFSNGIDKDNYIEFESKSEKVFTLRNITVDVNTSLTSRNGLVALASDFGSKFDAAQHYFIQTEGTLLSAWPTKLPDSKELSAKNEPFKIKAGTYDIRVDFSKTKPDVTFNVPTPIANIVHEYPQLYLYGIGNAPVKFTKTDDGFECKNVEITTENAAVYISPSPDFNAATSPCLIAGENNKLVLVRSTKGAKAITLQSGKYNITVDLPGGKPELRIDRIVNIPANLYLFGNYEGICGDNLYSADNYVEFEKEKDKVFVLKHMEIGGYVNEKSPVGEVVFNSDYGDNFDTAWHYSLSTTAASPWPASLPDSKEIIEKAERTLIKVGTYDIRIDFSQPRPQAIFTAPTSLADIIRAYSGLYLSSDALSTPLKFEATENGYEIKKVDLGPDGNSVTVFISGCETDSQTSPTGCFVPDENGNLTLVRSADGKKSITLEGGIYSFSISLQGNVPVLKYTKEASGIDTPVVPDASVVYYNLQGLKVRPVAPGFYIRKQGDRTEKVFLTAEEISAMN